MLEISPVLSGKFDSPDYAPAQVNFTTGGQAAVAVAAPDTVQDIAGVSSTTAPQSVQGTEDASGVDARRYTKFDRTATDAGTADMSFGDFLDLINPLQHIPVVSAIYRAATNEPINPVSRVAGDILYGGALGVGSAVLGGIGAVGNSMVEAQTGKDATGNVVAALFGPDNASSTQLAQTVTPAADQKTTVASAAEATAAQVAQATVQAANNPAAPASSPTATAVASAAVPGTAQTQGIPLDHNKPFGGVMAMPNMQQQNMDMALASASSNGMRIGHTLYTSRLMNGPHPLPVATGNAPAATASTTAVTPAATAASLANATSSAAQPSASAQGPAASTTPTANAIDAASVAGNSQLSVAASTGSKTGPQQNPLPQALIDDMMMMKALNQYNNVAAGPAGTGMHLDVTN